MSGASRFLARWSRLKRGPAPAPAPAPADAPADAAPLPELPPRAATQAGAVEGLPPVETLDFDADFTAFLARQVDESVRRAAMRKLFSDPHFNRMDGLDVYIDDYGAATPIPPEVLARLRPLQEAVADDGRRTDEAGPRTPREDTPDEPERDDPRPEDPQRDEPRPGDPGRGDPGRGDPGPSDPGRREPPGRRDAPDGTASPG